MLSIKYIHLEILKVSLSNLLNFVSLSKTENNTSLNIDIRPKEFTEIIKITDIINKEFTKSKIVVARNNNLAL